MRDVAPINYGVADDSGKYANDGGAWFDSMLKGANLTEVRWSLTFNGDPNTISELSFLQRAAPQAQRDGIHVILALYGRPATQHDPTAFCSWAGKVASTVKQWGIHDYIVWNEPNTALFWSPQDATAPVLYEALLAQCYDSIHAADSDANVIGMALSPRSNGPSQTAPIPFIKQLGAVYRASGRTAPIMDQMSIHPYPNPDASNAGPDVGYANPDFYGVPNLDRVKEAVYEAFTGTDQPTTQNGLTFRIDELGWQTDTQNYPQYYNPENVPVVSEQTQADYIQEAVQKYLACDPTVTDVEWFLLVDEATRNGKDQNGNTIGGGWQSGLMTAGGQGVSTPKVAYTQDAPLFAQGRAACTAGTVSWSPTGSTAGSSGSSGSSAGGTSNDSGATLLAGSTATFQALFGKAFEPFIQSLTTMIQTFEQQQQSFATSPTTAAMAVQMQPYLDKIIQGLQSVLEIGANVQAVIAGITAGDPSQSLAALNSSLGSLLAGGFSPRSLSSDSAKRLPKPIVVASVRGSLTPGKGGKKLKLKPLHAKTKLKAGTYYLALQVRSATDATKRITIAVPLAKVKAAKHAKTKPTKKPKKHAKPKHKKTK